MPENILVVEYEPRYTERVRQALNGQPFDASFARDGDEALRALSSADPRLIVVSSIVPKISTSELIRAIRNEPKLAQTPILLTISGYNGTTPKADAQRLGASDILAKPYSEAEFLGKVQQLLGLARPTSGGGGLTSNQIFGDLLDDEPAAPAPGVRKTMGKQSDDLDKMLADTLAGVRPQKKTQSGTTAVPKPPSPAAPPPASAPQPPRPRTASENQSLDKMLEDTLSGLEKTTRAPRPAPPAPAAPSPAPAAAKPATPPAPAPPAPTFRTEKIPVITDKMASSSPVLAPVPPPAAVEEDEPKDGVKFGQYVLIDRIATGGMAEVWKARMRGVEGFQKTVAIKKILPHLSDNQDFIEMFIDEAKLAAQLNHNNIIHIYDLGKIQSSYYIAMEYVDGSDLKTILRRAQDRDQPMSVELALFVASKIAAALDYAHRKRDFDDRELGLVHRDVSPQNVLISEEGDIKLCDFGIAKAASKASHTQAGALKGKLQYMSPEQAWGKHVDKRSDIFALATVLFEMLTARKLFTGENELSVLEQVREARVTAPSLYNDEVTPEIDAIVIKALQKEPEKRYQTAGEMARDLDQVLYSFKPTPTSADLAIYMHRLAEPAPQHTMEPEPIPVPPPPTPVKAAPVVAPAPVAAAAAMPSWEAAPSAAVAAEPPAKKLPLVPIIVVAVLLIGAGAFFMMKRNTSTPAAATATTASKPVAAPPSATTSGATTSAPLTASTASTTTGTTTSLDQAKVDEEVRKRLEAERLKLEQQQAKTAATATQPAAAPASRPVTPAPQQVAQQTPAPVAAAPVPVPPPVVAPQPVAESRPAPQPAAPETPRTREGDLVPAGTEGLTPARITRLAPPVYPMLARQQRVEGSVLVNALIGETGQVLDAKVLVGVNRPVGINEAALQTVRRSTFSPGQKDGVRVKSWTTVKVDFKL